LFTPLDVCIRIVSATNHALKTNLNGRETWTSVEDSREEQSSISLMVSDNEPTAFYHVEIHSFRSNARGKRILLETIVRMDLDEDRVGNLRQFDVEKIMKAGWNFYPVMTIGTRYRIEYSKESGPRLVSKAVMNVSIRPICEEFSVRELEALDYDEIGEEIANAIAVANAIYLAAKQVPASR